MRALAVLFAALIAVSGCTGSAGGARGATGYSDAKPKYETPQPGVQVSGHAIVGVVTNF